MWVAGSFVFKHELGKLAPPCDIKSAAALKDVIATDSSCPCETQSSRSDVKNASRTAAQCHHSLCAVPARRQRSAQSGAEKQSAEQNKLPAAVCRVVKVTDKQLLLQPKPWSFSYSHKVLMIKKLHNIGVNPERRDNRMCACIVLHVIVVYLHW